MLINKTRLKEIVGSMQLTQEFTEALEKYVEHSVKKACSRAAANNRRTVMERDL